MTFAAARPAALQLSRAYTAFVTLLVRIMTVAAGLGIVTMIGITTTDVFLRFFFNRPVTGAFDIVRLAGALTIACGLPYTTAVKGHVAIEYFFHKLWPKARVAVDTVMRLLGMGLFGLLSWQSLRYGMDLRRVGEVTPTLQAPTFPVAWVISLSCAIVVLVIFHNLLHPGREMIKP